MNVWPSRRLFICVAEVGCLLAGNNHCGRNLTCVNSHSGNTTGNTAKLHVIAESTVGDVRTGRFDGPDPLDLPLVALLVRHPGAGEDGVGRLSIEFTDLRSAGSVLADPIVKDTEWFAEFASGGGAWIPQCR